MLIANNKRIRVNSGVDPLKKAGDQHGAEHTGKATHTVVLAGILMLTLFAWTAGVAHWLYGGDATSLGLALQFGGTIVVVGAFGAAIGISWGRQRDRAVQAAATSLDLAVATAADVEQASGFMHAIVDSSPIPTVAIDGQRRVTFWSAAAARLFGWSSAEVMGRRLPRFSRPGRRGSAFNRPDLANLMSSDAVQGARAEQVSKDGRGLVVEVYGGPLIRDGVADGYAGQIVDVTDAEAARIRLERLAAAVDQTVDGIVIADGQGTILYANPAYESQSGYSSADLVSGAPAVLGRGLLGDAAYESMSAAALKGEPWIGDVEQVRKDGATSIVQLSLSALRDPAGTATGYVAVQRDVTYMRSIEGDLALEAGVRSVLQAALHVIPADASLEEVGKAVCDGLCSIGGIDMASVNVFLDPGDAVVLALGAPDGFGLKQGDHLPKAFSERLFARAAAGSGGELWAIGPGDGEAGAELDGAGLKAFAFAPIVLAGRLIGGIGIGTCDPNFAPTLVERFPRLVDFSAVPTALLAVRIGEYCRDAATRTSIAKVIKDRAFGPVFQSIVDLASGAVVGHEALTRFNSGRRPDLVFSDALHVGLGIELELATLEAAIVAARDLPAGGWLDINVSPTLLLRADRLHPCVQRADRPLVFEVTEHEAVADYPKLREAVRSLGPNARLAVDDAGAGIANFAHIVELEADLVKLDISLVRNVDSSPGRQALVLGLCHFARTGGCRLVAEGIETAAEARTLTEFGVEFGQGYWFGKPCAASPRLRVLAPAA
ncbi:MAG: EAL domain-containing protein [Candidatus Dormibacteria bacterium]